MRAAFASRGAAGAASSTRCAARSTRPRSPRRCASGRRARSTRESLAFTLRESFADDSWAAFADLLELVATDAGRAGAVDAGARLARFDRPILVVAGDADDLAPPSGARPLFERVGSAARTYLEAPAGHIDLLIGDNAPGRVWSPITRFLRRHLPLQR